MARSRINTIETDLVSDSGSVLFSLVRGEALEFPIKVQFVNDIEPYVLEAVVVEGENAFGQDEPPEDIEPSGVETTLFIRIPIRRGVWDAATAYNREDIVIHSGSYYKLLSGVARVASILPEEDPLWEETALNVIYVQFPASLVEDYKVLPIVGKPVYGFFELRVTEPNNSIFVHTWKPVRGMVEVLFSPTHIVPDL
jgi:hypothetical protein